jgi:chaperonin cofactor prefoldin
VTLSPAVKKELSKTEAGKWFVAHWPILSLCVSGGMISVYLAKGILKYGKAFKEQLNNNSKLYKNVDELIEESRKVVDEADLFAKPAKIHKSGGKILKAKQIRKLRGELKTHGGLLILEEDLLIKKIINQYKPIYINGYKFEKAQDLFYFMNKKGYAGAYDAKTKQMVLGKNATELVAFHEKAHLLHFEKYGEAYHSFKTWEKETYVWEQIWSRRRYWSKKELQMSLDYVNRERIKEGIQPLKIKL